MVTDGNQTYRGDHFIMYRNIKSLCCVTGTNRDLEVDYIHKQKKSGKESRFVVTRSEGWWEGKLNEGGQKAQTLSYKINMYQGCNIQ